MYMYMYVYVYVYIHVYVYVHVHVHVYMWLNESSSVYPVYSIQVDDQNTHSIIFRFWQLNMRQTAEMGMPTPPCLENGETHQPYNGWSRP